jgi:hypothetical protein
LRSDDRRREPFGQQERCPFELLIALENLNPKMRQFVLAARETGEIREAAASVGF